MQNALRSINAESVELQDCAARKLADDVAVVSLLNKQKAAMDGRNISGDFYLVDFWKKSDGNWQILARYSSPVAQEVDRRSRPLPPPLMSTRSSPRCCVNSNNNWLKLRCKDSRTLMERLVGSEFTLRMSDAPQISVPRALWGQPSSPYKVERRQSGPNWWTRTAGVGTTWHHGFAKSKDFGPASSEGRGHSNRSALVGST
jgi:Domain of unknown function (DUF4440)